MAGRSSSIDVFLRLHGQRKFAKEVEASGAELEAMGLKGAKSMSVFAKSADKLKGFGKSWTRHVSLPIAGLAAIAGGMAVSFKRQMGLVATDAGGTAREVGHLETAVLGLARESQFGPQKLAESLFHVESSGYRGAKAMHVLRESQELATTGNSDLQETTYALVSATKALYGESTKNVRRTAAEINGIVAHGDMRLEELTASFGSGLLAKAKAMGLGLRDVGAAMDVMTARGIPAQRAAYALGFTLQKLIPYGTKAEEAFASIGLGEETLIKASQHGKYGYVTGLEVLQKHLDLLPTKAQQTKVIEEMFGGGRMTSGLLTDLQNLGEMKKIYGELGNEVKTYNKHTREAREQPQVKLETAWSSIRADLIEIGGELVPVIVPAAEDFARYSGDAAGFLEKVPGPVKAIGLAALLLTGPVATGLGFFASGVGRTLILLAKLGRISQNVGIFAQALRAGQGLSGSASIGFAGFGKSAAVQTAKGFAYSLAPAVAAYGIGNIVTSATESDWQDAGAEAGGALVGGIAGFMVGGPLGAMLGVGIGSFGGELLSKLFTSGPKISQMRRDEESLTESTKAYHEALSAIPSTDKRVETTTRRHSRAVDVLHKAQRGLARTLARFGPETQPATRAQLRLDEAQRKVTRSARAERNAHRLAGNALKLFRMESVHQTAQLKQSLPLEAKRIRTLNQRINKEPHNIRLVKQTLALEQRHAKHQKELIEVYAEAESKSGKPWTARLEKMTTAQAKYGEKGKVLVTRLEEQRDALKELAEEGASVPLVYQQLREEVRKTARELGNFNANVEGIGPARLNPDPPGGHNHAIPQRQHPNRHGHHGHHPKEVAQRLAFPRPRRSGWAPQAGGDGAGAGTPIVLQLVVDSQVLAEKTAMVAKRKSLLQ